MMKLVKIASTKESWKIYDTFLEDYFMTKAKNKILKSTLKEELKELENERFKLLGIASYSPNEETRVEYQKQSEQLNERIKKLTSAIDNQEIDEALQKQSHLTESKVNNYVTQAEFGDKFNCKIGSKTLGKLLIITKICRKNSNGRTSPYHHNVPRCAVTDIENETFRYKYDECIKQIDSWLKENDCYNRFYSITDSEVMELYINNMYERFVLKYKDEE